MRRVGEALKLGGEGRQRGETGLEGEGGEGYFKHGKPIPLSEGVCVAVLSTPPVYHLPAYLPKTSLKGVLLLMLGCKEGPDSHRGLSHGREDPKKEILRL